MPSNGLRFDIAAAALAAVLALAASTYAIGLSVKPGYASSKTVTQGAKTLPPIVAGDRRPLLVLQQGHAGEVLTCKFSPDGNLLVTTGSDATAKVWDLRTGQLQSSFDLRPESFYGPVCFTRDGRILAIPGQYGGFDLREPMSGKLIASLPSPPAEAVSRWLDNWTPTAAFSPDGRFFSAMDRRGRASVWDVRQRRLLRRIPLAGGKYWYLDTTPDGDMLAPGCRGAIVQHWNVAMGSPTPAEIPDQNLDMRVPESAFRMLFPTDVAGGRNPAGPYWMTPSHNIGSYSYGSTQPIFTLPGDLSITNGGVLGAGSLAQPAGDDKPRKMRPDFLTAIGFAPQTHRILTERLGSGGLALESWDAATGNRLGDIDVINDGRLAPLSFSPDGLVIAVAAAPGKVTVRDSSTGTSEYILPFPDISSRAIGTCVSFSADGASIACGCNDGSIDVWRSYHDQAYITEGTVGPADATAQSPDGKLLATTNTDGCVRLWNLDTGRLVSEFKASTIRALPRALAFSGNGHILAVGEGASLYVRDVPTGQHPHTLQSGMTRIVQVLFSHDSRRIYVAGNHGVEIWNVATGTRLGSWNPLQSAAPLFTHVTAPVGQVGTCPITAVNESPNGNILAAFDDQAGVTFLDSATGSPLGAIPDLEGDATDTRPAVACFSPDGKFIAGLCGNGPVVNRETRNWEWKYPSTACVWNIETGRAIASVPIMEGEMRLMCISPDGKTLAIDSTFDTTDTTTLLLADVRTGRTLSSITATGRNLVDLRFLTNDVAEAIVDNGANGLAYVGMRRNGQAVKCADLARNTVSTGAGTKVFAVPSGRLLATMVAVPGGSLLDATGRPIDVISKQMKVASRPIDVIAKPIDVIAKPIDVIAKPIDVIAKPIDVIAKPIDVIAKPIDVIAKGISMSGLTGEGEDWFTVTPEGYFDCSLGAATKLKWNIGGRLYPAARYMDVFRRPDLVRASLAGQPVNAPSLTYNDIPPSVRFISPAAGAKVHGNWVKVVVEESMASAPGHVNLLVNGRPVAPRFTMAIRTQSVPSQTPKDGSAALSTVRLTYRVPLPRGASRVVLSGIGYDATKLNSEPASVTLTRTGARPVEGNLYALCVGIDHYLHADNRHLTNLNFPTDDARDVAAELKSLHGYRRIVVHTLTDAKATAPEIRRQLNWLRTTVRPGQVDTVVVYLSGHGYSSVAGQYYYITADTDPAGPDHVTHTSLTGAELRDALGGSLSAKQVFVWVDSCHAGAMGSRGDDLEIALSEGIQPLVATPDANGIAYESPHWRHGAFTLALLESLQSGRTGGPIDALSLADSVARSLSHILRST
ncbi:MAG: caspase family protein [Capsulimonadaceae bacterium]